MRNKTHKDENFPVVLFFMPEEKKKLIMSYYDFARFADDIADNPNLSPQEKIGGLNELESKARNKDFSDLLLAFRRDAEGRQYRTWEDLLDYCRYSAAPVGRFMLSVYEEGSSALPASDALCAALQIVNHIQDIKYDAEVLKRIYLPKELMIKYNIKDEDLIRSKSPQGLRNLIGELLNNVKLLLKDAAKLPTAIKSKTLALDVFVIFSLTNIMIKKIEKGDVLTKNIKLSKFDWLRAVATGVFKVLLRKRRII